MSSLTPTDYAAPFGPFPSSAEQAAEADRQLLVQTRDLDYAAYLAGHAAEATLCLCCLRPIDGEVLTDPDFETVCAGCAATLNGAEQGFEEAA